MRVMTILFSQNIDLFFDPFGYGPSSIAFFGTIFTIAGA